MMCRDESVHPMTGTVEQILRHMAFLICFINGNLMMIETILE
jgi:hypothetical protein